MPSDRPRGRPPHPVDPVDRVGAGRAGALALVPVVAGSLRLVELAGGPHALPANPRITVSPIPVIVHIVSAVVYAVVGAFQFSAALRRRRPGWHRAAGLALGAGNQVFTQGIGNAVLGTSERNTALMLGAGWGINLAVAEYIIRRRGSSRRTSRARIGRAA